MLLKLSMRSAGSEFQVVGTAWHSLTHLVDVSFQCYS